MTDRDEFINWVQSVVKAAEIAVHNGDSGPRRAIWSRNDPVTVLGAARNAVGQVELDELFDHLANSFADCTSYELELLTAEVLGDVAYTVGFEHTSATVHGTPRSYSLRATQVYRREDGAWKVAHRHGSAPPDQPDGGVAASAQRTAAPSAHLRRERPPNAQDGSSPRQTPEHGRDGRRELG